MARKKRKPARKNSGNNNNTITKATRESRRGKSQISTAAIEQVRYIVEMLKPIELSQSRRLKTFQAMLRDDAVWSAVESRTKLVSKAQSKGYFQYDKNSPESVRIYEFLKWNMDNLVGQTPRSIGRSAAECMVNGIAPFEKVFHKTSGEFEDKWKLKKLAYIHPLSLDPVKPYETTTDGDEITFLRQSSSAFTGNANAFSRNLFKTTEGVVKIRWDKVCYTTYSASGSQPFGVSPFEAAYTAWREKVLLQDYALVGVTKDFAGTPILYLPKDILEKASVDPTSREAAMVDNLQQGMSNLNAGDQTFMILPSDTQSESGNGLRETDIRFLGIEGSGKNFDINELIEQRKRAIHSVLGSPKLDEGVSYNMLEGDANLQAFYVEEDNSMIEEMWNKQIFPQLMRLNEWEYKQTDIPVWVSGEIQPLSSDEVTKGLQRCTAVGLLPKYDTKFLNEALEKMGYEYRYDENMSPEDVAALNGTPTSRSGDGMETGLPNGTGDAVSSIDTSVSNMENV